MDNQITIRDRAKMQITLVILCIVSDAAVFFLLLDKSTLGNWESEWKKVVVIIGISCIVLLLSIGMKRFNNRKYFCYLTGVECIIFSLIMLCTILKGYYNLYEKLALGIIYIYMAVVVILFLLCKNFYKKLPSEEELDKKKKIEPQKGLAYVVAASTLGVLRYLSMDQIYVISIIISIIISCGWLVLGWFMFQGTKVYINDIKSETINKE